MYIYLKSVPVVFYTSSMLVFFVLPFQVPREYNTREYSVTPLGVATETDFFGPDRKSRPTEWTGRTGLRFNTWTDIFGPM
jgi:hypothetical protein